MMDPMRAFLECRYDDARAQATAEFRCWVEAAIAAACGDFRTALDRGAEAFSYPRTRARAAVTIGSVFRQQGAFGRSEAIDEAALALADTDEDRAHLLISHAADAVGGPDPARCFRRLTLAVSICERPTPRLEVRHAWVATEYAILTGDPRAAVGHAERALVRSDGMPRHLAKSSLFLGIAARLSGDLPRAASVLEDAIGSADAVGARPVAEVARRERESITAGP